jgi:hypothetical protein
MKNGKAAGADNILAEVLKADPYMSADILLSPFQVIWQKEKLPKDWKEGIIIKIPKKGDLSQCRNWRGITLLAVISKIFNKIILERIKNSLEMSLRKEQAGFHHNRSCIDQINTLRVIIEQSVEFQSPLYMLFVDHETAFNSLNRAWIWNELKARGLPSKFINIIKLRYILNRLRWSRGSVLAFGTQVPWRRVQTRPKPSDFFGRKNPQHAFLRRGSKAVGPLS